MLERALELAEPESLLMPFLLYDISKLLQRHRGRRTSHAGLVAEILGRLPEAGAQGNVEQKPRLREPFTKSELRVLRYLPTNLSAPEISNELNVSLTTVKTHMRHVYSKLDVHGRTEAVTRARALGLLASSSPERRTL